MGTDTTSSPRAPGLPDRYLPLEEAAKAVGYTPETLRKYRKDHDAPVVTWHGRLYADPAELVSWARRHNGVES